MPAQASGFSRPVASGVTISAKPADGLVKSPLSFFSSADDAALKNLVGWVEACVRAVVSRINGASVAPERLRVTFNESWFHVTRSGGFHDVHVHGNCSWCGIYYLRSAAAAPARDGSAGNGINRFYSPMMRGGVLRDFGNSYLGRDYVDIEPRNGRLVIFPAHLLHSALPYVGDEERIILSFNSRTDRI
ncbi:MAG: putative 2OG-Fe(II) oxygenase [Thermohalobaculum sp.]|nr:putative 2OG-Fe(II) oxygenase [Thermohalobaculum sp.]